jgi:hypothetical protein
MMKIAEIVFHSTFLSYFVHDPALARFSNSARLMSQSLAAIGARRRREMVQKVHMIDPWGLTGGKAVLGARSSAIVLIILVLDAPNYSTRMIGM